MPLQTIALSIKLHLGALLCTSTINTLFTKTFFLTPREVKDGREPSDCWSSWRTRTVRSEYCDHQFAGMSEYQQCRAGGNSEDGWYLLLWIEIHVGQGGQDSRLSSSPPRRGRQSPPPPRDPGTSGETPVYVHFRDSDEESMEGDRDTAGDATELSENSKTLITGSFASSLPNSERSAPSSPTLGCHKPAVQSWTQFLSRLQWKPKQRQLMRSWQKFRHLSLTLWDPSYTC